MQEQSLSELMNEAFNLSLDLCYETLAPDGSCLNPRQDFGGINQEDENTIWAWCDGLYHKYYERMSTGRCSVQAMVDFDIAKFEENVKRDIQMMKTLFTKLPAARKLTFHEMQIRGYRGRWAGEFPLLTA